MLARVRKFLDVRPGEGQAVLFTFLYVALAIASFVLAKNIRNGLFLETYGASKLVYVYVAVSLVLSVVVPAYSAIAARVGQRRVIIGSLLFLCLNVLGFWWALHYAPRTWLSAAFYVWVNCYGVIAPVGAWTFANAVFDTRQARRLFGLVSSGGSVGAIVGGLLTRLVDAIGTVDLLLVLAGLIALTALVVNLAWHVRRRDPSRARRSPVRAGDTWRLVRETPYLWQIALLVALVAITTQWAQYQFQAGAAHFFTADADRLTRFFGDFNTIMGAVALLVQVLATGPLLRRFGLSATILALPFSLAACLAAVAFTGSLWAVVATMAFDQSLRFSIDKASFELLYLPIRASVKDRVKPFIDLIVTRVADSIGAILLALATTGFFILPGLGLGLRGVATVNLVFVAGWVVVALALRRGYVEAIRESITAHRLEAERASAPVLDRSATTAIAAQLGASEPQEILYALDLFQVEHRGATHPAVRGLLAHPSPEVRRRAVAVLDRSGDRRATDEIEALLDDPDPGVRAEALIYLAHHADVDPLGRIATLRAFEDFSVQASLVAFLGRESAWQNVEAARLVLRQMVESRGEAGARARLEAARLLDQLPAAFPDELRVLLADAGEEVARAALRAAGHPGYDSLVFDVLQRLRHPALREAAAAALAGMGPSIVDELRAVLEDRERPTAIRGEVPRVLSSIGGADARDALVENLFETDASLRTQIVAGLSRLHARFRDLDVDRQALEMMVTAEIMGHYRSYQILGSLQHAFDASDHVKEGLVHAIEQEQERIFRLLDPLMPDADLKSVYLALRSQNRILRANALELLDNVLSPSLRALVVPLFDAQVTTAERVAIANELVGAPVSSPEEAALAMLASEDPWLRACGVYAAGVLRLTALRPEVRQLAAASDPLLRETARAALARLDAVRAPGVAGERKAKPEALPEPLLHGVDSSFGVG